MGTTRFFNHHVHVGFYWLALVNACLFYLSCYAASWIYWSDTSGGFEKHLVQMDVPAIFFAAVATLVMFSLGLYEPRFREGTSGTLIRNIGAFGLTGAAMATLFYFFPDLDFWRGLLVYACMIAFSVSVISRFIFNGLLRLDRLNRDVLVLGTGELANQLVTRMRRQSDRLGFNIVGFARLIDEEAEVAPQLILSINQPLSDFVLENAIDEVVVAVSPTHENLPADELVECRMQGIEVTDVVGFFEQQSGKILVEHVEPGWLIFSQGFQKGRVKRWIKRAFDVSASFILLALTWPFMLGAVIAIWLEEGLRAPLLYRQVRVGLNGHLFEVLKFRSMSVNAEKDGAQWASKNDSRVTRVGRFIRKTRIDELPQILNVLVGDMAFVGPRPERPEFAQMLARHVPHFEKRLYAQPGITGWAQLNYPYGSSIEDARGKLEYDLYYVKNQSLFLDLTILLQTVEVILFGKGAR